MKKTTPLPDLSALDVQQLRLLYLLLTRSSVSAVADALGVTQPAVSLRLARLREVFGDPLLVRAGAGMVPTDRGQALIEPLGLVLDGIDRLSDSAGPFDPAQSRRHLRISIPNYMGAFLMPKLAARLTAEAPHMQLSLQTIVPGRNYDRSLAEGEIDLLVANWPSVHEQLRSVALPKDRLVCIMAQDHPLAAHHRLTLKDYLAARHISPSRKADWRFSPVDAQLTRMKQRRTVQVVAPNYTLLPHLVASTRLILTTGSRFSEFALRTAPVVVTEAPAEFEPVQFRMLWHERSQADEAHAWARGILRGIALSLRSGASGDDAAAVAS
jgi:DNA-binding transcriptional LysR family regulator